MTVSLPSSLTWEQALDQLVREAQADRDLQQQLVQNPRQVLKHRGFIVSSDIDVIVVPQNKSLLMRQMPALPSISVTKKKLTSEMASREKVFNGSTEVTETTSTEVELVAIDECCVEACDVETVAVDVVVVEVAGSSLG